MAAVAQALTAQTRREHQEIRRCAPRPARGAAAAHPCPAGPRCPIGRPSRPEGRPTSSPRRAGGRRRWPRSYPGIGSDPLRDMAADIRAAVDHAEHLIAALLILARSERGLTVHDEVDLATVAEDVLDSAALTDRRVHCHPRARPHIGRPGAGRTPCREPAGQCRPLQHRRRRHLDQHPQRRGQQSTDRGEHRHAHQPGGRRPHLRAVRRLNERASHDGFGLGLTIVASIAALHGGTASAHPRDDGGLSVTVTLSSPSRPSLT